MKNHKKNHLILSLLILTFLPVNAYCDSQWDRFLKQQNEDSLLILEKSIAIKAQKCNWGDENNKNVTPTAKQELLLFNLIDMGNSYAFQAALLVHRCWDGGDLEDFYRSSGMFFEKRPLLFLQIAKEKAISDSEINYMLTMLPLDTVDNINLNISMVENRINVLKKIDDESLNEIRKKGLSFLETEKNDLQRIVEEIKKK
jgi:hypothetical protein